LDQVYKFGGHGPVKVIFVELQVVHLDAILVQPDGNGSRKLIGLELQGTQLFQIGNFRGNGSMKMIAIDNKSIPVNTTKKRHTRQNCRSMEFNSFCNSLATYNNDCEDEEDDEEEGDDFEFDDDGPTTGDAALSSPICVLLIMTTSR
jgi:hypothetical protein